MTTHFATATARPFLKWAGGKTQLLDQFARLYPEASRVIRFHEPFVGSGAVYFDVVRLLNPRAAYLADGNEELIHVYIAVQQDVETVIGHLKRHRREHDRDHYYAVRARHPDRLSPAARAARFIYLNKTCFNGLYRVNGSGLFNVPMGRYADPPILDEENLRASSAALAGARIRAAHFREVLRRAHPGDFVYLDPPYHPLSGTACFTSYTQGSFGRRDQEELADIYARLSRRGCLVMLSNSDAPFVRDLYRGFDVRTVMARRSINSRADRRGKIPEVVVLNYEPPVSGAGPLISAVADGSRRASRSAPRPRPG